MLNLFEKLINEHGSSTILRENLVFLKTQYTELQSACENLQTQNKAQELVIEKQQININKLTNELEILKSGALATYVCDHCGSPDLKRKGSRPDAVFGRLGVKEKVFECNACGQESAFTSEQ